MSVGSLKEPGMIYEIQEERIVDRKEFYNIVKSEGLSKYDIGNSIEIPKAANVIGCIDNNGWVVYETDERGAFHVISRYSSEEEGLEFLLGELRNKKRKEEIMKKLRNR